MDYTKTVRAFCLKNQNQLFDVSYMASNYFAVIPRKTLLKILSRLTDGGLLLPVSKGVFYIQGEKPFDLDRAVEEYYINGNHGMFVGYKMYNELQVSDYTDDIVEIYTNRIGAAHKSIGKYHLTYADVVFDNYAKQLIQTLELTEHFTKIIDLDYIRLYNVRQSGIRNYLDYDIDRVTKAIPYQRSTLVTFDRLMKEAGFSGSVLRNLKGA